VSIKVSDITSHALREYVASWIGDMAGEKIEAVHA
jgi:hypothetical protein